MWLDDKTRRILKAGDKIASAIIFCKEFFNKEFFFDMVFALFLGAIVTFLIMM